MNYRQIYNSTKLIIGTGGAITGGILFAEGLANRDYHKAFYGGATCLGSLCWLSSLIPRSKGKNLEKITHSDDEDFI